MALEPKTLVRPAGPDLSSHDGSRSVLLNTQLEEATQREAKPEEVERPLRRSNTGPMPLTLPDGKEVLGTRAAVGSDAWGAAVTAIVRNVNEIIALSESGKPVQLGVARLSCCVCIAVLNVCMQLAILYFVHAYVVEPSVRELQQLYKTFHSHVYDASGVFNDVAWKDFPEKGQVCGVTLINRSFYYMILFLWALTCLAELRAVEQIFRSVCSLKTVQTTKEMIVWEGEGILEGDCDVVGLTVCRRVLLLCLVLIPRALIAVFLAWLGARWLSSSHSFSDMVLNSLALGFVIGIDELLFHSVLPAETRQRIKETHIFLEESVGREKLAVVKDQEWNNYKRTAIWVLAAGTLMFAYGEAFQSVLPPNLGRLRDICVAINDEMETSVCDRMALANNHECYPAGVGGIHVGKIRHRRKVPQP